MDIATITPCAAARGVLRDACRGIHAHLDQRLSEVDFNDRAAYADMLSRLSAPVTALEAGLTNGVAPVLFTNWAARLRAHALRSDVEAVGGDFRVRKAHPIEGEAEALGALYVLEGSRLGGQVLARMVQQSRDERVRAATRYFLHGAQAGLWRSFLQRLEQSPAVAANPERATHAALSAFAAFQGAFA